MLQENKAEKINFELEKRMKGLIQEGISLGSIGWIVGKTIIINNLSKELGIRIDFEKSKEEDKGFKNRFNIILADFLLNTGIIRNRFVLKIVNWFFKMPSNLFLIWYYDMDGHKLLMNDGDIQMKNILNDYTLLDIYEPETTKIVKEKVKEGMIALDIGASIGYFTLQFCRQVGKTGKVISFEPTEMNFNYLCENIRINEYSDRSTPYKMAGWDKKEIVKMPLCSPKPIWANGVAIGEFLEQQGIDKVDFIKLDVDGPEPKVLKGLIKIFEKNTQLKMVVEYYPKYIKNGGCSPEEFMEILNKYFTYKVIPGDYVDGCWNLYCERKNE